MSENIDLKDYQIIIGGEDIIAPHFSSDNTELPFSPMPSAPSVESRLNELLKEIRVRFGTLLKTDNISFLFGAGASLSAGGLSLVNIPTPLEKYLVDISQKDKKGKTQQDWITLLYETASLISESEYNADKRIKDILAGTDTQPIPINLEAFISHLYMWLAGLIGNAKTLQLINKETYTIEKEPLVKLINYLTSGLAFLLNLPKDQNVELIQPHKRFIKKILTRPLNLRRANIFTINYDTLIEQAADSVGAVLVDGFVGNLKRIFRPESFDIDFYFPAQTTEGKVHRFDRAIHLYKLHGSITWHRDEQTWENPYGIYATYFNQESQTNDVLIYPSPLKYGQALDLPYSELFRRFGNAIAQPQSILFVIGYGFGDDHVNALIHQALAIPSFTLVIIDPKPSNEFVKKLEESKDERVWIVKGNQLGKFENFVEKLLPDLQEEEINEKVIRTYRSMIDKKES